MQIVTVSHRFYPSIGGTEHHTYLFSKYMAKLGNEVFIVTSQENNTRNEEEMDGFKIIRIPIKNIGKFRIPIGYARILKKLKYDILYINGQRVWAGDWIYPFIPVMPHYKVFMAHGFYQYHMNPSFVNEVYYSKYFVNMMKFFDIYIALTENEKNTMLSWGYSNKKIKVLPSFAIDREEDYIYNNFFERNGIGKENIILNIGGFYENKRVDLLIESAYQSNTNPTVVAIGKDVPGSRFNKNYCINLAREKGIKFYVFDSLSREDIISAYKGATIMVHPAQFEGLGIIFLEAMKYGIPFVSFDVGIAKEVASKSGNIIVKSIPEMAKSIQNLLGNKELRERIKNSSRKVIEDYYADNLAKKYNELFKSFYG
ncbi:MAG: glycosyltransferase family 4 protein [Thermoplasmata archaeon]